MKKENILEFIMLEIESCTKLLRQIEQNSLKYNIDPELNPVYNCIVARKAAYAEILNLIRSNNAGNFQY